MRAVFPEVMLYARRSNQRGAEGGSARESAFVAVTVMSMTQSGIPK